jgi:uncharacterized protein YdaU (DUF1376 family)
MAEKRTDLWMAFYINDYAGDTFHLNRAQHGSYLHMLMAAFKNAGWLPNDDGLLAQIAKCTPKEWKAERALYAAFFQITDERWTHKRVTLEWEKAQRLTEQRRAAGAESAAKRQRQRNERSTSVATVMATDAQRNGRQSQSQPPTETNNLSVSDSAPARVTHTGWSAPIPEDWKPGEAALQRLRVGRPDLVGEFYDQRLQAFRLWCREKAITSHDFEATWMKFMIQSHAAPTPKGPLGNARMQTLAPEPTADDWKGRVDWFRTKGMWNPNWGPTPDQPGCFAPKELLQ